MTNRSLPRVPVIAWMLGQRLVLHLASRHWLDYWLLSWWLAGAVIRAWTEKAATWESHWALSGIMVLSMTKGVPEFDSVQNQDTECVSPSSRRPLSLNKGLQDKLENKRALVDRKRKKGFCNVFLAFSFTYPLKAHGRRKQASTEAHVPMHSGLPRRYLI